MGNVLHDYILIVNNIRSDNFLRSRFSQKKIMVIGRTNVRTAVEKV